MRKYTGRTERPEPKALTTPTWLFRKKPTVIKRTDHSLKLTKEEQRRISWDIWRHRLERQARQYDNVIKETPKFLILKESDNNE